MMRSILLLAIGLVAYLEQSESLYLNGYTFDKPVLPPTSYINGFKSYLSTKYGKDNKGPGLAYSPPSFSVNGPLREEDNAEERVDEAEQEKKGSEEEETAHAHNGVKSAKAASKETSSSEEGKTKVGKEGEDKSVSSSEEEKTKKGKKGIKEAASSEEETTAAKGSKKGKTPVVYKGGKAPLPKVVKPKRPTIWNRSRIPKYTSKPVSVRKL